MSSTGGLGFAGGDLSLNGGSGNFGRGGNINLPAGESSNIVDNSVITDDKAHGIGSSVILEGAMD